jgi:hypothetical protein
MPEKLKKYSLVLCLFVFLFIVIGGGFHLNPGGALVAALSGTPLVIYAFNRRSSVAFEREEITQSDSPDNRLPGAVNRAIEDRSPRGI